MKFCAHCKQDKFYDPTQLRMTKASGFYNTFCWDCRKQVVAESCRRHNALNSAKRSAAGSKWARENPGAATALVAKRQAALENRTPAWADLDQIKVVYIYAAFLGLEVDHVIPLQGKTVSGLHVYENLQLLAKSENVAKSNRFAA